MKSIPTPGNACIVATMLATTVSTTLYCISLATTMVWAQAPPPPSIPASQCPVSRITCAVVAEYSNEGSAPSFLASFGLAPDPPVFVGLGCKPPVGIAGKNDMSTWC